MTLFSLNSMLGDSGRSNPAGWFNGLLLGNWPLKEKHFFSSGLSGKNTFLPILIPIAIRIQTIIVQAKIPMNPRLVAFAMPLTTERCDPKIENTIESSWDPTKRLNIEVMLGTIYNPMKHLTKDMIHFTILWSKASFAC